MDNFDIQESEQPRLYLFSNGVPARDPEVVFGYRKIDFIDDVHKGFGGCDAQDLGFVINHLDAPEGSELVWFPMPAHTVDVDWPTAKTLEGDRTQRQYSLSPDLNAARV